MEINQKMSLPAKNLPVRPILVPKRPIMGRVSRFLRAKPGISRFLDCGKNGKRSPFWGMKTGWMTYIALTGGEYADFHPTKGVIAA